MATAPITVPGNRAPRLAVSTKCSPPRGVLYEKRIDNSHLVREIDPERHKQCFTLMGIVALAFAFVFLFAWEHFRCVRYGYEIEQLRSERAALTVWNQRLHLEQALLADPQRIDRLARTDLGLAPPAPQQVVRLDSGGARASAQSDPVFARNFEGLVSAKRGNPREF